MLCYTCLILNSTHRILEVYRWSEAGNCGDIVKRVNFYNFKLSLFVEVNTSKPLPRPRHAHGVNSYSPLNTLSLCFISQRRSEISRRMKRFSSDLSNVFSWYWRIWTTYGTLKALRRPSVLGRVDDQRSPPEAALIYRLPAFGNGKRWVNVSVFQSKAYCLTPMSLYLGHRTALRDDQPPTATVQYPNAGDVSIHRQLDFSPQPPVVQSINQIDQSINYAIVWL